MSDVRPFRIEVPEDQLVDLKRRLRATRWPDAETPGDWSQGIPLAYVQEVCAYWAERYDWRATEARLNRFPQFTTTIDGVDIHGLHVRSQHPDALPLVITHGWPGSTTRREPVPRASGGPAAASHVAGARKYRPGVSPNVRRKTETNALTDR
jgi:hypothetical protein